jgi:hypothetical protein
MTLLRKRYAGHVPLHREDPSSDLPAEALAKAGAPKARRRMIVIGIPLHDLDLAWPALWPLLERAARRTKPAVQEAEVRSLIERRHAQLWAIYDRDQPVAAVTTEITLLPEKRCRIWLVGGSRMDEWAAGFMTEIEGWARSLGCAAVWGEQTRPGWRRVVKLFGGGPIETANGVPAWGRRI